MDRPTNGPDNGNDHFRSIADNSPDVITRFDMALRHLYANPAAARASGLQPEELVGRSNRELGMPPEIVAFWEKHLRGVFETGESGRMEFSFPSPFGLGHYETLMVPEHGADGAVATVLCFTRDVTARKAAELELLEADRRKTRFLAVLSHELRNPLASIRLSLDVLRRTSPDSAHAPRALEIIDRQARAMTRLLEDLLDVTRISEDKVRLKSACIDLAAVAEGAAEDHREAFVVASVRLDIRAGTAPLWVYGDEVRLRQIIGNLLQNALRFSPAGGRTELAVYGDGDQAVVTVSDDGIGIAPEMRERIFEAFVQLDDVLDRNDVGLGLGLALVRGFAELHGGSATVDSPGLGQGASFIVRLPRVSPSATAAPAPAGATALSALRILIIEDNADVSEMVRAVLVLLGQAVETALTGPSGIDKARSFQPDLILCDIGLPGMNGYEVARAVRADPALRHTPLVALSGYGQSDDLEQSRRAGFDRHLVKPVSLDDLQATLAAVLPRVV